MTVEDVATRVNEIKAAARDPERAHGLEDDLYRDVLEAIIRGAGDPTLLAAMALTTKTIKFSRWCA